MCVRVLHNECVGMRVLLIPSCDPRAAIAYTLVLRVFVPSRAPYSPAACSSLPPLLSLPRLLVRSLCLRVFRFRASCVPSCAHIHR